tara:strand:- start:28 stop:378 length:351 start_codon:yes stop_codon:yes gene_type:complete
MQITNIVGYICAKGIPLTARFWNILSSTPAFFARFETPSEGNAASEGGETPDGLTKGSEAFNKPVRAFAIVDADASPLRFSSYVQEACERGAGNTSLTEIIREAAAAQSLWEAQRR